LSTIVVNFFACFIVCPRSFSIALNVRDIAKDVFGKTSECAGYGQYCVQKYAAKNPDNARRNADTYALFALAAYYGIDEFQTDPNKLTLHSL
jgi:hypothetical protein